MHENLKLFIPITKVDEEKRLVYGVATAETPDSAGEICDYDTTVPYYKAWSGQIEKASEGRSKGNLRSMHGNIAAGKITQIAFNDTAKQIEICGKVVDDAEWKKVTEGVYTGFSQGGSYVKTWKDGQYTRYTAKPSEVSLVDNPCLPSATFTLLRLGGAAEMRKFQTTTEDSKMAKKKEKQDFSGTELPMQVWKAKDGSTFDNKADALKKNADLDAELDAAPAIAAITEIENALTKAEDAKKDDDKEMDKKEDDGEKKKEEDAPVKDMQDKKEKKEAEKSAASVDLKKYMGMESWDAKTALEALIAIEILCAGEEAEGEGTQTADLKEVINRLKSFISSEIMETGEETADSMEMAASGDMEKIGAKISSATKRHIESMHKSATAHMGEMDKCYKALGMMPDDEAGKAEKMAKIAEHDSMQEEIINRNNENEALKKQLSGMTESLTKVVERLTHIEKQPLPVKGKLFSVEKGHEVHTGKETPAEAESKFYGIPAVTSPEMYRNMHNVR